MQLFYIFENLLNVWLNGRQLDFLICFWIQTLTISHVMKPLKSSTRHLWKVESEINNSLCKFLLHRCQEKGSGTHSHPETHFENHHSGVFQFHFKWENRVPMWVSEVSADQQLLLRTGCTTSYLSPRFSPQQKVYLFLDHFDEMQMPRYLITLKMKAQVLK